MAKTIEQLIDDLSTLGGVIVSSSECGVSEIAQAETDGRFAVTDDALGFVRIDMKVCRLARSEKENKKQNLVFEINEGLTQKFREWYTNGGWEELYESIKKANITAKEMQKAFEPDWSKIHEPMTI